MQIATSLVPFGVTEIWRKVSSTKEVTQSNYIVANLVKARLRLEILHELLQDLNFFIIVQAQLCFNLQVH